MGLLLDCRLSDPRVHESIGPQNVSRFKASKVVPSLTGSLEFPKTIPETVAPEGLVWLYVPVASPKRSLGHQGCL